MKLNWDQMQARLIDHVADGLGSGDIAARLSDEFDCNVTRNAVIGRCFRMTLSIGAPLSTAQKDDVRRRLDDEKSAGKPLRAWRPMIEKRRVCFDASPVITDRRPQVRTLVLPAVVKDADPAFDAPPAPAELTYGPASLLDIRQDQCRFIAGEPSASCPCMCGMKVRAGASYCESHHARVYTRARTPKSKQADDARRMSAKRCDIPARLSA